MLGCPRAYGYIYKTTNRLNGRFYIGQKKGPLNNNYFGSGKALRNAVNKYGTDSFQVQILDTAYSREDLDRIEISAIKNARELFGNGVLYNISDGGEGRRSPMPDSAKIKISQAMKGRKTSDETRRKLRLANLGKKHSEESKKRMSIAHSGFRHTEEFKQRMSRLKSGRPANHPWSKESREKARQAKIGKSLSAGHVAKIGAALRGRPLSTEHKKKISDANRGRIFSEQHKTNLSLTHIGQTAWNRGIKMPPESVITRQRKIIAAWRRNSTTATIAI